VFQAAKGSQFIALVLAVLGVVSAALYFRGGTEARDYLFFAVGFALAAFAELYRPAGLFGRSWRQVPASPQLLLYCSFSFAAVAIAVVGSALQWP
jgi:mannose/fructose/N-acetylgalactosamine-specific phosphotransferase system component IIC